MTHTFSGTRPATVWAILALVTIAGAWLRFADLGAQSLWYDEITQVRISSASAGGILAGVGQLENDMPLDHFLQHFFVKLGGETEFWIRFHAALLGSLTIPLAFLLARAIFGTTIGLTTAALLAFSPFHLHYSREARPYALFVFLTVASTFALWNFFKDRDRPWVWGILYGMTALASVWAHFAASVVIALQQVWIVSVCAVNWVRNSPDRRRILHRSLLSLGIAMVCAVSLLPTLGRLSGGAGREAGYPFTPLTSDLLLMYLNGFTFALDENQQWFNAELWVLPFLVVGLAGAAVRRPAGAWLMGLLWLGFAGAILLSCWWRDHWFALRYVIPALVPFLVFVSAGLVWLVEGVAALVVRNARRRSAVSGTLLAAILLIGGAVAGSFLRTHPFEKRDWRAAAEWIVENVELNRRVLTSNREERRLGYYLNRLGWLGLVDEVSRDDLMEIDFKDQEGKFLVIRSGSGRKPLRERLWGYPYVARPRKLDILYLGDPEAWFASDPDRVQAAARSFMDSGYYLDVGAESFLATGIGWGWEEESEEQTFRWSAATTASLLLCLPEARDADLQFCATVYEWDEAPTRTLRLRINGMEVARGTIVPRWKVYQAVCPPGTWKEGVNRVDFLIDRTVSPSETRGKSDPRPLGIGLDWLSLPDDFATAGTTQYCTHPRRTIPATAGRNGR